MSGNRVTNLHKNQMGNLKKSFQTFHTGNGTFSGTTFSLTRFGTIFGYNNSPNVRLLVSYCKSDKSSKNLK